MKKIIYIALGLVGLAILPTGTAHSQTLNEPVDKAMPKEGVTRVWSNSASLGGCADGTPTAVKKCASWEADPEFTTGHCRLRAATVTVFANGDTEWSAEAKANVGGKKYSVSLHFQDRVAWVWIMPPIRTGTLGSGFTPWTRADLYVAEHLYPTLAAVSRWDDCVPD